MLNLIRISFILMFILILCSKNIFAGDIHNAAKGGLLHRLQALILNDSSLINERDDNGNTPLHLAVRYDQTEIVSQLLSYFDIDVNAVNNNGETPFFVSARYAGLLSFSLLKEKNPDPFIIPENKQTLLHASAMSINKESSQVLAKILETFPDIKINQTDSWHMPPLHLAAKTGNVKSLEILIKHGSDITLRDGLGRTALHWAAEIGNLEVSKVLIKNNVPINVKCINSGTALHLASIANRINIIKLLKDSGADLTIKDSKSKTALRYALEFNHKEIIQILIEQN